MVLSTNSPKATHSGVVTGVFQAARLCSRTCGIKPFVFQRVTTKSQGFSVVVPRVIQAIPDRVHAPHPRGIRARDRQHLLNQGGAFGGIGHVFHALKQGVEARIVVIGGIFSLRCHFGVGAIEQEEKVFWIGIIGIPAPPYELVIATQDFTLELVVVGRTNLELYADGGELFAQPIEQRFRTSPAGSGVKEDDQGCAVRVTAVRIACFSQQPFGGFYTFAAWHAAFGIPVIDDRVNAIGAFLIPKNTRRNRPLGRNAPAVEENLDVLVLY